VRHMGLSAGADACCDARLMCLGREGRVRARLGGRRVASVRLAGCGTLKL
jgi:hypothetical protein